MVITNCNKTKILADKVSDAIKVIERIKNEPTNKVTAIYVVRLGKEK